MVDEKEKKDFQKLVGKIEDRIDVEGTKQEVDDALFLIERNDPELEYGEGLSAPMTDTTIEEANKVTLTSGFEALVRREKKGFKAPKRGDSGGFKPPL